MKIVGVGCGPGMLTEQAAQVIRSARFIYGSGRAIEMVKKIIPKNCTVRSISDYRNLSQLPENAVVLSTGDPMLAGLGTCLAKWCPVSRPSRSPQPGFTSPSPALPSSLPTGAGMRRPCRRRSMN